jgi:hypothetical protein
LCFHAFISIDAGLDVYKQGIPKQKVDEMLGEEDRDDQTKKRSKPNKRKIDQRPKDLRMMA